MSSEDATLILPDGKTVKLPIIYPSGGGNPCIDVRTLGSEGYFTYDPGFTSTASCTSALTFIDGPKGILLHRGYRIEDLASNCTFLEVAYLLLNGALPSSKQLIDFRKGVMSHMMLNEKLRSFFTGFKDGAHPMAIMVGVVGSLSAFYEGEDHAITTLRVIAKLPTIAAMAYKHSVGQPYIYPRVELSYSENFLHMMFATPFADYRAPPAFVDALDLIFLLHADHEQNASTTTVRIAGSSDANPLACVAAGIASLWGPMHGGANEAAVRMLRTIGTVDKVPEFLEKVKRKECKLMGFGHRVYKNIDPRAKQMKKLCDRVLNLLGEQCDITIRLMLDVAMALEKTALSDDYFVQRKLFPNVDFYSGITLTAMGIPTSMFTVLFAIGRSAGWIAQWKESVEQAGRRISRPRQVYVGEVERDYIPLERRGIGNDVNGFLGTALRRQSTVASDTAGIAHSVSQAGLTVDSSEGRDRLDSQDEMTGYSYFG
jgi:citrate synthase